jgi:cytochrome c553
MKSTSLSLALAVAALSVAPGCATTERSRTLNNPSVPAVAMAQQVCSNCHGLDGNSTSPNFPRLAAQQPAYLAAQLTQFRNHGRSDPAGFVYMWGLSRHLSDDQIKGLAGYFSAQAATANAPAEARYAERGKSIFETGIAASSVPPCSTCHGTQGHGTEAFPRLAGQHADYVVKQLVVFQQTEQRPQGAVMKTITHALTKEDMRAVASYVQGLR